MKQTNSENLSIDLIVNKPLSAPVSSACDSSLIYLDKVLFKIKLCNRHTIFLKLIMFYTCKVTLLLII